MSKHSPHFEPSTKDTLLDWLYWLLAILLIGGAGLFPEQVVTLWAWLVSL